MKSGRVVYQNGVYVDEKDAKVSIFDSALSARPRLIALFRVDDRRE